MSDVESCSCGVVNCEVNSCRTELGCYLPYEALKPKQKHCFICGGVVERGQGCIYRHKLVHVRCRWVWVVRGVA